MAMTVADLVFVDTNVLVYANIATAPLHAIARQKLQDLATAGTELWISRQVLREYLAVLTLPQSFTPALAPSVLAAQVGHFQALLKVAEDNSAITQKLLHLLASISFGGRQVHDANLVATMLVYNIPKLLTHNTKDFARFASFITVVPLVP